MLSKYVQFLLYNTIQMAIKQKSGIWPVKKGSLCLVSQVEESFKEVL